MAVPAAGSEDTTVAVFAAVFTVDPVAVAELVAAFTVTTEPTLTSPDTLTTSVFPLEFMTTAVPAPVSTEITVDVSDLPVKLAGLPVISVMMSPNVT